MIQSPAVEFSQRWQDSSFRAAETSTAYTFIPFVLPGNFDGTEHATPDNIIPFKYPVYSHGEITSRCHTMTELSIEVISAIGAD